MFIREIKIKNFKGFKGEHILVFGKNLTFFVGDNNSGKSTVFEAVDFLKSGLPQTKKLSFLPNTKISSPLNPFKYFIFKSHINMLI